MERLQRDPLRSARAFTLLELLVVIGIIVIVASLVLAVSSSVARASEERTTRNTLEVLNMAAEEYERTIDRRVAYRSGAVTGGIAADGTTNADGSPVRYDVDSVPTTPPAGSGTAAWNALATPYTLTPTTGGPTNGNGLPAYSFKPFQRTVHLLQAMTDTPTCAAIMQKLPESIFRGVKANTAQGNFTGVRHCIDAWDTPIVAIFPGREANAAELATNNPNVVDKDGTVRSDSEWGNPATQGGMQVSCKDRRILFISAGNDSRFTVQTGGNYQPSNDNLYSYEP